MSLRDRIIKIDDTTRELVKISQWQVEVEVRSMTGAARAQLVQQGSSGGTPDMTKLMPEIVVMCTFDPETGEQVFDDNDHEIVMGKNGAALEQIMSVAMRLSGFSATAIDDAGKDSSSTPKEGSSSI